MLFLRSLQEEENACEGDTSNGQIDVEAPTPTQMIGERASHEWPSDGRYPVHRPNNANIDGSSNKRDSSRDDDYSAVEDTSRTESCDRSTND
jgi:hypothetical protein